MITEKEIELKLKEYKGLLISTAKRYHIDGMDFDDIFQELSMEFVKALKIHDQKQSASLKTLFVEYAIRWARKKLESQERYRKNKVLWIDDGEIKDGDKMTFITSDELTPEEVEKFETLQKELKWFYENAKDGWLIEQRSVIGMTLQEIADIQEVSFQAIAKRHQKAIKELRKYLKEKGYKL